MSSPTHGSIRLRTLGSLDLSTRRGEESESTLVQGKRMALLCYLVVARPRGFHRRDTLCGLFWPDVDQGRARAALRQALHLLRQSLGQDVVQNRGPEEIGVHFSSVSCDAIEFEEILDRGDLEVAVELYGGPFLHGFYLSDTPEFEKWLSVERDRIATKYADALRSLAAAAGDAGDHNTSARWWKRLAIHDPYSPEVALQLMASLDAAGERAAAIEHARVHTAAVHDDLEMQPDVGVQEFAERLKSEPSHRPVPPAARPAAPAQPNLVEDTPRQGAHTYTEPVKQRSRPPWYAIVGVVAALSLIGVYALMPRDVDVNVVTRLSVGILPFENLGSSDDDYFVNGMAEDLARRLAGVQILRVAGPRSMDAGASVPSLSSDETSRSFDYVLRIAVERTPGAAARRFIRLTASLARAADGLQLWSESFDGDPAELFALQARLAEAVPRALSIPVLSNERDWLRSSITTNLQAYEQYLQGSELLRAGTRRATQLTRAVEQFRGALAIDSAFVHAHAKLAIAHTLMFAGGFERSAGRLVQAKSAADRALYLRADAPISHLAQAWYYYRGTRDYDRALRHFEIASASWAGLGDVRLYLADIRRRRGDLEQALDYYAAALNDNPACAVCAAEAALTHLILRDYDAAEQDVTRAVSIAPDLAYPRQVAAVVEISAGATVADAAEHVRFPTSPSGQVLVEFAAGRWGAIFRAVGGEFEDVLDSLSLTQTITDTAGYFLAKAEVLARRGSVSRANAHYNSARVILEPQVLAIPADALLRARLGLAYAGLEMREDAIAEALESARLLTPSDDLVDGALASVMIAGIYTMVGDYDAAIDRLELLLAGPTWMSSEILVIDPAWAQLRWQQRFQNLVN